MRYNEIHECIYFSISYLFYIFNKRNDKVQFSEGTSLGRLFCQFSFKQLAYRLFYSMTQHLQRCWQHFQLTTTFNLHLRVVFFLKFIVSTTLIAISDLRIISKLYTEIRQTQILLSWKFSTSLQMFVYLKNLYKKVKNIYLETSKRNVLLPC